MTLDVPAGSLTALLGPSGGGKSTLLRVVAGLEQPDSGSVAIEGEDVTAVPVRQRGVGFCFQHYAPFRHLTVRRNVAFGLEVRRRPKAEIRRRVGELLELVRLTHVADRYPNQLSGGQRQRMALARALAVEPRVLLLDEPFGALDAQVRRELRAWLRNLHDTIPVTTLFVTHDQEEAMEVADHLAIIHEGRLEQAGSPKDLYERPTSDFTLSFLGPATRLGGRLVRPHDLRLDHRPAADAHRVRVERVTYLGFEVRVALVVVAPTATADGHEAERPWVQLSRGQADELGLEIGEELWVSAVTQSGAVSPSRTDGTAASVGSHIPDRAGESLDADALDEDGASHPLGALFP